MVVFAVNRARPIGDIPRKRTYRGGDIGITVECSRRISCVKVRRNFDGRVRGKDLPIGDLT